jgi:nucleoside-diphosphate-sugar epimerase
MRIVLMGATGYIGLHIVRELLAAGHEVTAVVRSPEKLGPFARERNLRLAIADLEQPDRVAQALAGQEVCIHAALLWGEPGAELEFRDTAAAARTFESAGQAGVGRCIYISSTAVHRPFSAEMSEEDGLSATDLYGATKGAGELVLRAACAAYQMTGIVLRPGPVVGAPAFATGSFHSDRRIESMVNAALLGQAIEVPGDGRQFSDVRAVAKAIGRLVELEGPHPVYLCLDRNILTWEWIARQVLACLGSPSELRIATLSGQHPLPHFRATRFEQLLGSSSDARDALLAHLHHLANSVRQTNREV